MGYETSSFACGGLRGGVLRRDGKIRGYFWWDCDTAYDNDEVATAILPLRLCRACSL